MKTSDRGERGCFGVTDFKSDGAGGFSVFQNFAEHTTIFGISDGSVYELEYLEGDEIIDLDAES